MNSNLQLAFSPGRFRFYLLSLFSFFASAGLYAQSVTGTVTDGEGKPVAGATISVKNTNRASLTTNTGAFTINAAGTDVLVITHIGYIEQQISISGKTSV